MNKRQESFYSLRYDCNLMGVLVMGGEDFLQRLLFNGNFCLEHEEKENRRIITSTEFNQSTSAILKILS